MDKNPVLLERKPRYRIRGYRMEAFRLSTIKIRKIVSALIFLSIASLVALLFSDDDPTEFNRIQVSLLAVNLVSFFDLYLFYILYLTTEIYYSSLRFMLICF